MGGFKTLGSRVLIAFIYVPLMVLSFILGGIYLKLFFISIGLFMFGEVLKQFSLTPFLILAAPLLAYNLFFPSNPLFWELILLFILLFPFFVYYLSDERGRDTRNITSILILMVFILGGLRYTILFHRVFGFRMALFVLISIWIYDNFAYFSGILWGKNRIFPYLSPKKSFEGVIGGLLCNLLLGGLTGLLLFYFFRDDISVNWLPVFLKFSILSFNIGLISQFGDLFVSYFKRGLGIKDFSNLLKGHGGILDRFDSILFVFPIINLLFKIIE